MTVSAFHLVVASGWLRRETRIAERELDELLAAPRAEVVQRGEGVLYLNSNLWFGIQAGGSVGHIAGVANELAQSHDVVVASVARPLLLRPSVRFEALRPPRHFGLPSELNYYRFQHLISRQLGGLPLPSLLYQRLSVSGFAGVVLARRWGVPLVVEYNGSEAWVAKNWGTALRRHDLAVKAEDAMLRHAHVVVTVSDVLRDELVARGVEPSRIVNYPNCIDPELFDPARFSVQDQRALRTRYGISPDAVVVGFIGTFGQWHGVEVLARAIAGLARDRRDWLVDRKLHFLLVGDGLRMPAVRRELENAAAESFVTLTGLVPQGDAPLHLAAADALVSPHVANADGSRFFGSPTKLFEYMAMQKPIVASDLDQIGDVLRPALDVKALPTAPPDPDDDRLAILSAPGDEAQLAEAIRFLTDQASWRESLGRNARALVLERYTWRHHVTKILERVEDVASEAQR